MERFLFWLKKNSLGLLFPFFGLKQTDIPPILVFPIFLTSTPKNQSFFLFSLVRSAGCLDGKKERREGGGSSDNQRGEERRGVNPL